MFLNLFLAAFLSGAGAGNTYPCKVVNLDPASPNMAKAASVDVYASPTEPKHYVEPFTAAQEALFASMASCVDVASLRPAK